MSDSIIRHVNCWVVQSSLLGYTTTKRLWEGGGRGAELAEG
jgi:hypothetical protein